MSADHDQAMAAYLEGLKVAAERVRTVFAHSSDREIREWLWIQWDPSATMLTAIGGTVPTHPISQVVAQSAKDIREWEIKASRLRMAKADADKAEQAHRDAIAAIVPLEGKA